MNKNIFNLTEEHFTILSLLEEQEGELSPEMEERLLINEHEFESKCMGYRLVIKHLEAEQQAIKEEKERLIKLEKSKTNNIERLKETLKAAMIAFDKDVIVFPLGRISFRKSTAVDVIDEAIIPAEYLRVKTTTEPNKIDIKAALTEGKDVPGCLLKENKNVVIS